MAEATHLTRALSPSRFVPLSQLSDTPVVRTVPQNRSESVHTTPDGYYTRKHTQFYLSRNDNLWRSIFRGADDRIVKAMSETVNVEHTDGSIDVLERGMFELGGEGETILLAAVLWKCKLDIIQKIVEKYPHLLGMTSRGSLHQGENEMHIAVAQGNLDVVKYFLKKYVETDPVLLQKVMTARSTGRAISEESGSLHLFGETVFHYAVKAGNLEIVQELVKMFPECIKDKVQTNQFNALHLLVNDVHKPIDEFVTLYRYICRECPDLQNHKNNMNQTPVQLAFQKRNVGILEILKIPLWQFEQTTRFRFPISLIDPIMCGSKGLIENAVENGDKSVLEHPVVETILKCKWKLYVREIFAYRLVGTTIFVIGFLTPAVSYQLYDIDERRNYDLTDWRSRRRLTLEIGATICALIAAVLEIRKCIRLRRKYFAQNRIGDNINQWLVFLPVITTFFLRATNTGIHGKENQAFLNAENALLGISCISGWIHFLSFAKGSEQVGPVVFVLWKTLFTNFTYWLWVYLPLTLGFAAALFLQLQSDSPAEKNLVTWDVYGDSAVLLLLFTLQPASYDTVRAANSFPFTVVLYFTYAFILILFLNILIAMLVETFNTVRQDNYREWKLQLASLILDTDFELSEQYRRRITSRFGYRLMIQDLDQIDLALNPRRECNSCQDPQIKYFHFTERVTKSGDSMSPRRTHRSKNPQVYPELISVVVERSDDGQSFKTIQIKDLAHWTNWSEFSKGLYKFLLWELASRLIDSGMDSYVTNSKMWKHGRLAQKIEKETRFRNMGNN
ncbi:Transient receptor putative cation channel sub V member 6 [Entophlyctis luteolus]|nr:Transient receptor putative cation channel sub V member 6 [Entophlyctis luteolus]KAJ3385863.1 Transient receptor putative cation channel sub V member 6 [Entophlyctis sp. JEL0112]